MPHYSWRSCYEAIVRIYSIFYLLNFLKSISIPEAYTAVWANSDYLLLFIIERDSQNFKTWVSLHGPDNTESIGIIHNDFTIGASCRHHAQLYSNVEASNLSVKFLFAGFVRWAPELFGKIKGIKDLYYAIQRAPD